MNDPKEKVAVFESQCKEIGITLSEKQIEQFLTYYEMLIETNKMMNLTAITEFEEVLQKHFLDSISIVKAYQLSGKESVIDVGTGAGFPGLPLKIVFPEMKIVLLDSLNKRLRFLNEVIDKLRLENISTIHGRAEDFGKDVNYREQFDLCLSRAVANLSSLSELCLPFVKVGGSFISYKSGQVDEEVKDATRAIQLLGGKNTRVEKFELPDSDISRSFVVISKAISTPKNFPRKAGIPTKKPILNKKN
jgi:16S rRNA (guanine527-N7)-methyltransferase